LLLIYVFSNARKCYELLRQYSLVYTYSAKHICMDRYHVTGVQQCSPKSNLYYTVSKTGNVRLLLHCGAFANPFAVETTVRLCVCVCVWLLSYMLLLTV
jgi:hypothetical protein